MTASPRVLSSTAYSRCAAVLVTVTLALSVVLPVAAQTEAVITEPVLLYARTFENGTTDGLGNGWLETTVAGVTTGEVVVVDNPRQDRRNPTAKVARCTAWDIWSDNERAELTLDTVHTFRERYLYKWSMYLPNDLFTGGSREWMKIAQWKTAPCGRYGWLGDEICYTGGIFNDIDVLESQYQLDFRLRAKDDCFEAETPIIQGRWVDFEMDVFWTPYQEGHVKIKVDGVPVFEAAGIRTLFQSFSDYPYFVECRVYWSLGIYTDWTHLLGSDPELSLYIDNLEVWQLPVKVQQVPEP